MHIFVQISDYLFFFACSLLFERSVCILRPPYYLWLKKTIQPSFTFLSLK